MIHLLRARQLGAGIAVLSLLLPASASLPLTQWNLHIWRRLATERREVPEASFDRLLRSMAPYLPASGIIGLVQIEPVRPDVSTRVHYFVQYALAPRKVVPSAETEVVIVYGAPSAESPLPSHAFQLVKAFGDDARLYRRTAW